MSNLRKVLELPRVDSFIQAGGLGDKITWVLKIKLSLKDARYAPGLGFVGENEFEKFLGAFVSAFNQAKRLDSVSFNGKYSKEISWACNARLFDNDAPKVRVVVEDESAVVQLGVYSSTWNFIFVSYALSELDNVVSILQGAKQIGADLVSSLKVIRSMERE